MLKGPFWVVGFIENGDISDAKLAAYVVKEEIIPTPSHKSVWKKVCGERKEDWNCFPRGRVEIRNGKAVVFLNPLCFLYPDFESCLRRKFQLGDIEITYKTDNSFHYSNGVFES